MIAGHYRSEGSLMPWIHKRMLQQRNLPNRPTDIKEKLWTSCQLVGCRRRGGPKQLPSREHTLGGRVLQLAVDELLNADLRRLGQQVAVHDLQQLNEHFVIFSYIFLLMSTTTVSAMCARLRSVATSELITTFSRMLPERVSSRYLLNLVRILLIACSLPVVIGCL